MTDEPKWANLFGSAPDYCGRVPVDEWLDGTAGKTNQSFLRPRSTAEAVAALDAVDVSDPEVAHGLADDLLLAVVDPAVAEAYRRVVARARWWG